MFLALSPALVPATTHEVMLTDAFPQKISRVYIIARGCEPFGMIILGFRRYVLALNMLIFEYFKHFRVIWERIYLINYNGIPKIVDSEVMDYFFR